MTVERLKSFLLSVPVQVKILGIGALVAVLFGVAVGVVVHSHLRTTLEEFLSAQTQSLGRSLALRLERPLITGDRLMVHEILEQAFREVQNLVYCFVEDAAGGLVGRVQGDLQDLADDIMASRPQNGYVRVRTIKDIRVFETRVQVLDGYAGALLIGLSDAPVQERLRAVLRVLLLALLGCAAIGFALAVGLTRLLTAPIEDLVEATRAVGEGRLDVRARVYASDEVGKLAAAFNSMVQRLSEQHEQIERKEAERRRLLERVITSQEEERARVARELHDELGQSLSAVLLNIHAGHDGSNPNCLAHRSELERMVSAAIDEVRSLAWNLRPSILDDFGLRHALQRYVEEASRLSSCKFDFQYVVDPAAPKRIDGTAEVVLYRVAQEAITNILRHSGASRASVVLYVRPKEAALLVEDNGCGFDLKGNEGQSLGIMGMRERVELLRGEFIIESAPGAGTSVRARIPLGG